MYNVFIYTYIMCTTQLFEYNIQQVEINCAANWEIQYLLYRG